MIIGTLMALETCLILGQGSLSSLHWKKTSRRIYVVRGETDKKAANIQARLIMASTLDEIGKKCQAEGRQKWSREKPQLDTARKSRGIYFIDLEDKEFKETISQEIGNTSGSCYALQNFEKQ